MHRGFAKSNARGAGAASLAGCGKTFCCAERCTASCDACSLRAPKRRGTTPSSPSTPRLAASDGASFGSRRTFFHSLLAAVFNRVVAAMTLGLASLLVACGGGSNRALELRAQARSAHDAAADGQAKAAAAPPPTAEVLPSTEGNAPLPSDRPEGSPSPARADTDGSQATVGRGDFAPAHREAIPAGGFLPLHGLQIGIPVWGGVAFLPASTSASQGVGSVAPALHVGADLDIYDLFTMSFSYGFVFPADQAGFSQTVTDGNNVFQAGSSATMHPISLLAGARSPVLALSDDPALGRSVGVYAFARVGYSWMTGGRSIPNCDDCATTNLTVQGGATVDLGLHLQIKRSTHLAYGIFADYRQYFGASITREIPIGFEIWGISSER